MSNRHDSYCGITRKMKRLLLITFSILSPFSFCQLKSVIIDGSTNERIPYVNIWVEGKDIGTTSSLKGEFKLEIDNPEIIVFSAIGYETKKVPSDSIRSFIKLKPEITKLNEVIVTAKMESKDLTIGDFKKHKLKGGFGSGSKPWIVARYFEHKEIYRETPFLEKIEILTTSYGDDSKFNIRLHSLNDEGEPGPYLYDKGILGIARKGKKYTEIDISELNITFPENGLFIAMEWLILAENKIEDTYIMYDSDKEVKEFNYNPTVGAVPAETNENSWVYHKGKWSKFRPRNPEMHHKRYRGKYNLLAMKLTLSN